VAILPFMEQDSLFKQFWKAYPWQWNNPKAVYPRGATWWDVKVSFVAAQYKIPNFLCPSDDAYQRNNVIVFGATTITPATGGFNAYFPQGSGGDNLGRTNYLAMGGA